MALVSKSKAAKLASVSRTTIHRYVKNGKLSANNGEIETSELIRVFGDISETPATPATPVQPVTSEHDVTPPVTPPETAGLTSKVRDLENLLSEMKEDRDTWRDQAQSNQRLLEDKSGQTSSQDKANRTDQVIMVTIVGILAALLATIWFTQG